MSLDVYIVPEGDSEVIGYICACISNYYIVSSEKLKEYNAWSYQNACDPLTFLLDNILFDLALNCIVGIPIDTYCAPLVTHLSLFCYKREAL